ncbi:type VI secretion system contractile sheath large subunit [Lentisphaerota bacterium ZTH]|nr:type VI secretion system contractile sheath large subunit [Lentisphaerota bacterium]WET07248.1 type VI secretion system contractile sheath large subunit [Lentisphaerota bacterium ZTH]
MLQLVEKNKKNFEWLISPLDIDRRVFFNHNISINTISSAELVSPREDTPAYYGLLILLANIDSRCQIERGFDKSITQKIINRIDIMLNRQINEIIRNKTFRELESNWLGISDLVSSTDFDANIKVDLLDITKQELMLEFELNSVDISNSELFKKVYFAEYDQFGGKPYASLLGLYDFSNTPEDISFLSMIGKISASCHAPFIGAVAAGFFGIKKIRDLLEIKDINGLLKHPRYRRWNHLRNTEQSTYLGLTLPHYLVRAPWHPDTNPAENGLRGFIEDVSPDKDSNYVWAPATLLLAKNLTRSFKYYGWCQHIKGETGGGLLKNLPMHIFNTRGKQERKSPVECIIPEYYERLLSNAGLIPLIYKKNTSDACFFNVRSLKEIHSYKDTSDTKNSIMYGNLAYTFSASRIAHYIKEVGRLNVGVNSDAKHISNILNRWINQYVTEIKNPDANTLAFYPFKKANVKIETAEGQLGWYRCKFSVLPHVQFEGADTLMTLNTKINTSYIHR